MKPLDPYWVLSYGSLRFDGIKHRHAHKLDPLADVERFLKSGAWPHGPLETMTAVFHLQRWLCHWGGEDEPHDGPWWWAFRTLFLRAIEHDVPEELRGPRWSVWERDYLPRLAEAVAAVRAQHESTVYTFTPPGSP
jgi:hypothetical protein